LLPTEQVQSTTSHSTTFSDTNLLCRNGFAYYCYISLFKIPRGPGGGLGYVLILILILKVFYNAAYSTKLSPKWSGGRKTDSKPTASSRFSYSSFPRVMDVIGDNLQPNRYAFSGSPPFLSVTKICCTCERVALLGVYFQQQHGNILKKMLTESPLAMSMACLKAV
jgi:hypothetical protein